MIIVVDYDASWPERFEALRADYAQAMANSGVPVLTIESTRSGV